MLLTWEQFRDGIAILLAAFPKLEPDEEMVQHWYLLLQDLTPEALRRGVLTVCQLHRELYPGTNLIALIRFYALPDEAPPSCLAWMEVHKAVRDVGPYARPAFSHPRIAEVVEMISWRHLCDSEHIAAERDQFLKAYEQISQQASARRLLNPALMEHPLALLTGQSHYGMLMCRHKDA